MITVVNEKTLKYLEIWISVPELIEVINLAISVRAGPARDLPIGSAEIPGDAVMRVMAGNPDKIVFQWMDEQDGPIKTSRSGEDVEEEGDDDEG